MTALNLSRNAERAKWRYRAFLAKLPPPDLAPSPEDQIESASAGLSPEAREVLTAARPNDRELLALTALEGFTVREAAIVVGLFESAAKMRLSRLRGRLRGAMSAPELTLSEVASPREGTA